MKAKLLLLSLIIAISTITSACTSKQDTQDINLPTIKHTFGTETGEPESDKEAQEQSNPDDAALSEAQEHNSEKSDKPGLTKDNLQGEYRCVADYTNGKNCDPKCIYTDPEMLFVFDENGTVTVTHNGEEKTYKCQFWNGAAILQNYFNDDFLYIEVYEPDILACAYNEKLFYIAKDGVDLSDLNIVTTKEEIYKYTGNPYDFYFDFLRIADLYDEYTEENTLALMKDWDTLRVMKQMPDGWEIQDIKGCISEWNAKNELCKAALQSNTETDQYSYYTDGRFLIATKKDHSISATSCEQYIKENIYDVKGRLVYRTDEKCPQNLSYDSNGPDNTGDHLIDIPISFLKINTAHSERSIQRCTYNYEFEAQGNQLSIIQYYKSDDGEEAPYSYQRLTYSPDGKLLTYFKFKNVNRYKSFFYDENGNLTETNMILGNSQDLYINQFEYDINGKLVSQRLANGWNDDDPFAFSDYEIKYDKNDRVEETNLTDYEVSISWEYTEDGKIKSSKERNRNGIITTIAEYDLTSSSVSEPGNILYHWNGWKEDNGEEKANIDSYDGYSVPFDGERFYLDKMVKTHEHVEVE